MSELSEEARALLAREAPLDEPTAAELERGRAQVFAALGLPLPDVSPETLPESAPTPTPSSVPTSSASSVGLPVKLAALSIAVGLAIAGVVAIRRPATQDAEVRAPERRVPAETPRAAPAPETRAEADSLPEAPREAEAITTTAEGETPRPVTARETERDALATESMLVAAAEAQLRAGHASEALSLFDRYLSEHPRGALRQESLAGRIAALCRLGRVEAGRAELERFASRFPRSPNLPRLDAACGVEP